MKHFGFLMAITAQRNSIFFYITAIRHQGSVSNMMCVQFLLCLFFT